MASVLSAAFSNRGRLLMSLPTTLPATTEKASAYLLSLMRIVCALILFSYGAQKVLGFPVAPRTPPIGSMSWIAGLLELTVGFFLLIGFMSRSAAFILSGLMAAAYFIGHFPTSFFPSLNGGAAAAVLSFVFLYLAVSGPGPLSLDARLERGRAA